MNEERYTKFYNPGENYYFLAPDDWVIAHHPDYSNIVQANKPDGSVSITLSGFKKLPGQTLRTLADGRYEAKESFLTQVGDEHEFPGGLYIETEGLYPGETQSTYYVMGGLEKSAAFFTFSIVTVKRVFEAHGADFLRIVQSVCSSDQ